MKLGYMTNAFGPLVGEGGGVTSIKDIRKYLQAAYVPVGYNHVSSPRVSSRIIDSAEDSSIFRVHLVLFIREK